MKSLVPEVRVVLHEVPEHRALADVDERLRDLLRSTPAGACPCHRRTAPPSCASRHPPSDLLGTVAATDRTAPVRRRGAAVASLPCSNWGWGVRARTARRPVHRRPQRRHRDRLRRHGAAPARRAAGLARPLGGAVGDAEREAEARASADDFLVDAGASDIEVAPFRESYFPYVGAEIKDFFNELRRRGDPDLVLCHHRHDEHQDHRTGRRAHVEHLPQPPHRRVRDPQVRGRPRAARTCS